MPKITEQQKILDASGSGERVESIKNGQSETVLYLFDATEAAKDALREAGFSICVCCNDAKLLRINTSTKSVHGAGRGCESECDGMCFEKCSVCEMADEIRYKHNISVYHDVDELISAIEHKSNNFR